MSVGLGALDIDSMEQAAQRAAFDKLKAICLNTRGSAKSAARPEK